MGAIPVVAAAVRISDLHFVCSLQRTAGSDVGVFSDTRKYGRRVAAGAANLFLKQDTAFLPENTLTGAEDIEADIEAAKKNM